MHNEFAALSPVLEKRLSALVELLKAAYSGGSGMSSASVGYEREAIANLLLGNVIAPPFRLGTGDIIDASGTRSGQLDIIVEQTPSISFPMVNGLHPRLYLAEGVAAVVEVKSNIAKQHKQVKESAAKLATLARHFEEGGIRFSDARGHLSKIPHFVVSFNAWKRHKQFLDICSRDELAGVLSIDPCIYCSRRQSRESERSTYECLSGPIALARFMVEIEQELRRRLVTHTMYHRYDHRLDCHVAMIIGGGSRFRGE